MDKKSDTISTALDMIHDYCLKNDIQAFGCLILVREDEDVPEVHFISTENE